MQIREGDLVQIQNKIIFDVKGLIHPPDRVVAYPRFVPDPHGNHKRDNTKFRKIYALSERYKLLDEEFPQYLVYDPIFDELLCEVWKKDIQYHYNPVDRLIKLRDSSQLDQLEADALRVVEHLQTCSGVSSNKLGITGSLLAHLHTQKSDLDLIIYGKKACRQIYNTLKSAMKEKSRMIRPYKLEELKILYDFRSTDTKIPFKDFVRTERRKILQGKSLQHDFYIRCLKDWGEIKECYGDTLYKKAGYAKIKAQVVDASEAIFTPCNYSVDKVQVLEGKLKGKVTAISSFRGRFCEQARSGETVIAQGKVERVQRKSGETFNRLLLGSKPADFMALKG
ncbi:MAG: hypothetical protein JSV51_01370 [Candidatus Bathyarchaeota archaeon]|nr:MAG: hypothetical protein JSV51_01370 [Candidatus Bathyarchaeota archaeon]